MTTVTQTPLPSVTDYSALTTVTVSDYSDPNTVTESVIDYSATVQTHVCRNFSLCPNHLYSFSADTRPCPTQSRHTSLSHTIQTHVLTVYVSPVERTTCTEQTTESTCGENNSLYRASYGVYLRREQFVQSILRSLPVERTTPRVSYVYLLTELPVQSNLMYVCLRIERLPVREGLQNKRGEGGLQNKGGELSLIHISEPTRQS